MSDKPAVNICIPVYYSGPEVPKVLNELLESIEAQDYPRLRPVLSMQACDAGDMGVLKGVVENRGATVYYPQYTHRDGPAENTNRTMQFVSPDAYVKIMNQDDFLDSPTAISEMVEDVEASESEWLINACIHTDESGQRRVRPHMPFWPGEKGMVEGINRFGCPSVSMFKKSIAPECDRHLALCMDCDMWIQLYRKAGAPVIRNVPDVVIRMWDEQLSNKINYAKSLELDKAYMRHKYGYV